MNQRIIHEKRKGGIRVHMQMMWKRIAWIVVGLTLIFIVLIMRLVWIQVVQVNQVMPGMQRTMREMSVLQRERGVILDSGRGQFTDIHGLPLTGKMEWGIVLFPQDRVLKKHGKEDNKKKHKDDANFNKLASILHIPVNQLIEEREKERTPHFWTGGGSGPSLLNDDQLVRIRDLHLEGAEVYPLMTRYSPRASGSQWLGYLSEQQEQPGMIIRHQDEVRQPFAMKFGAAGLERTLEPLLRGVGPTMVTRMVSGDGQIIPEIGPRVIAPANSHYPLNVETTIDARLQQGIEELTESSAMEEGAVVVLDTANADVRAMVSRPFYHPQRVDPQQTSWGNRAVQGAVPGSIFKIVTAAAALEHGVVSRNEKFHCEGTYGKYGLSCWKNHGHGELNLEEGFAESCNIVFAETARRLRLEQLEQTTDRLGLARSVGWQAQQFAGMPVLKHFDHEEPGRIRTKAVNTNDEGAKIQTAIGQRDVRVTPLQAANLIVTLLHEGRVIAPRLVQRIRYADGDTMLEMPLHNSPSSLGQISPSTAHQLLHWMTTVVREGTGKSLQQATWHVAGKSGTAQVLQKGKPKNHQWFIGYGPVEAPRYAVAVLVQNVSPDRDHQATDLFRKVMDYLAASPHSL
ncbi:Penicillin-binding protein 4B [Paenibacillus sp. JJ-100]|uniref:peptidoglycan D,D-transpeptidase FtsI family protein n=1 Tax=Paenibacillus sp. JJ-100 TaxID=2974896 RepID=UPI0022FF5BEE|nr:penicillin-binding protein 2 [Paenibacillus sp. JJ-100]CAI6078888.1 Penicillin-binding protein 4B [Paenibacillus sp. JJ-100]